MSRFPPGLYRQYRPFYPADTFAGLQQSLAERFPGRIPLIADVGCGTGHSAVSLLRAGVRAQVIGIDPDRRMLGEARALIGDPPAYPIELRAGTGEDTGLPARSAEAILVGSALHWMDRARALVEFRRILRPMGLVRVFEYQFPKTRELRELNEWIRREFNLRWKAPDQKPRGDFGEITVGFRDDPAFMRTGEGRPPMVLDLDADDLAGLLLSQSRVQHFEDTLDAEGRGRFREQLRAALAERMGEDRRHAFDFKLAWVEFGKT